MSLASRIANLSRASSSRLLATRGSMPASTSATRTNRADTSVLFGRGLATIAVSKPGGMTDDGSKAATADAAIERMHHAVVSISGRDEAGIVNTVSSAISEQDANMKESKMAILGGDFAMIVYIAMKDVSNAEKLDGLLRKALPSFSISVRETTAPAGGDNTSKQGGASADRVWALSLEGPDHPGIVATLSEALAVNGCNVVDMETEITSAPFAGYELFKVTGKVTVDESKLETLSTALNRVEDRFGSTIALIQEPSS